MAKYQAKGDQTLTTTFTTAATIAANATTAQRNQVYRFILSIALTPSDSQITHEGQRGSADGTATAVTPGVLDPGDRAAQAVFEENHTIEPTYTADAFFLEEMYLNARATFVWNAFPGEVLTHAASAGACLGWKALHASRTEDWSVQVYWDE